MIKPQIKVATIDLYNNEPNEGLRCIREIVKDADSKYQNIELKYNVFDTRYKGDIPDLNYDIFISSGGPGSPFEGENQQWDKDYFSLIDKIWNHNQNSEQKKYIFFICHSFQMMARFFQFGEVNQRFINSFGVMPFVKTEAGKNDPILRNLTDPFYAADIRHWQVVNPNLNMLDEFGAKILSWEIPESENKDNPAITAVRISDEIVGTQFHPEADPESMLYHFKQDERKKFIIDRYNEDKYREMIGLLEHPDKIKLTRKTVLPSFLNNAIEQLTSITV
ncbi:MAG TPA: GMP synthase [Ignavibacteriales bacterium]|nr:GMP synthase [Ignavibacteriales bacterium]